MMASAIVITTVMGLTVLLSTILQMENLRKTELYCGGQNT
jgi:hypothetical protein